MALKLALQKQDLIDCVNWLCHLRLMVKFRAFSSPYHCQRLSENCEKRGSFLIAHIGRQTNGGGLLLLPPPDYATTNTGMLRSIFHEKRYS